MRARALLAAFIFVMAPAVTLPGPAFADGIERPHHRPRPHRRPQPAPVAAPAPVIEIGPEEVRLDNSFFAASAGGVGVDIGTDYVGGGTTVIVGSGGNASAFAFASARASAGGRGFGGGHHGGGGHGGGCGCH